MLLDFKGGPRIIIIMATSLKAKLWVKRKTNENIYNQVEDKVLSLPTNGN